MSGKRDSGKVTPPKNYSFLSLVEVMQKLRKGCPWDRIQTFESIAPYLIEETYEVLETIEKKDYSKLKEELGDLLFQVIFHSCIAQEEGLFTIADVIGTVKDKMIQRHPHVFGDKELSTPEEVLLNWEEIKQKEEAGRRSLLSGIPKNLPALIRAQRIQERVGRVGFDWENLDGVSSKLQEETHEFQKAIQTRDDEGIKDELGDILFTLVNISRFLGLNAEMTLQSAIDKFISRFQELEKQVETSGRSLNNMSMNELEELWQSAKQ